MNYYNRVPLQKKPFGNTDEAVDSALKGFGVIIAISALALVLALSSSAEKR